MLAPCRTLDTLEPVAWLHAGWADFLRAPRQSLIYGLGLWLLCLLVAGLTWVTGGYVLLLALLSGFVFIGPVLAIGLYSVSCQLERGLRPRLGLCLAEGRRQLGNALVFSVILLVVFLVWARAASMVHVFFPVEGHPDFADLLLFLGVGSAVGSVFAAVAFSASAFALPMLLDRRVDTVTAVLTSVHAVLRNPRAMAVWAGIIVLGVMICLLTGLLAVPVVMPVLGYATWHGYRRAIDPHDWPEQPKLPMETA